MPETMTVQELQRDIEYARRLAEKHPVVISEDGRPVQVLMSYAEYCRATGKPLSLADALGYSPAAEVAFELPLRELDERDVEF